LRTGTIRKPESSARRKGPAGRSVSDVLKSMANKRLALVAAVAAVSALGLAGCSSREGQPVTVLRGKSTGTNADRTGISLTEGKRVAGRKFSFLDADGPWVVAGARWSDGRSWHDSGGAPCLDSGRPLELGVVEVPEYRDTGGWGVVAWVKCL